MGVCNCSMFCCTLLCVRASIAIILMGKRELVALLNLPSWCHVMVERLLLAVPQCCLRFVIVVFPDHTHLLFYISLRCLTTIVLPRSNDYVLIFHYAQGSNPINALISFLHFYCIIFSHVSFKYYWKTVLTFIQSVHQMGHYQTGKRICEMPLKTSTQQGMNCLLSSKRYSATQIFWK